MPQAVEIVLTAHPTQINRRTLQYKHIKIAVSSFFYFTNIDRITMLLLVLS